jgi:hypothetical protein
MSDGLFWALVIFALLAVGLLIRFLIARRQPAKQKLPIPSVQETANQALRRVTRPDSGELTVIVHKNGDETRSSELDQTAAAEQALSQLRNGAPKSS